ncbi:MAG: autotransporter assembly complex family protein [Stappiaceae bacterium]
MIGRRKSHSDWLSIAPGGRFFIVCFLALFVSISPASAFELFGIHLWGKKEEKPAEQVIDPVSYDPTLTVSTGKDELKKKLETVSTLLSQKEKPPSGTAGLIGRARNDRERLVAALYQTGRYGGLVEINLNGKPLDDVRPDETLYQAGGSPVKVAISVTPGPVFSFGDVKLAEVDPDGPDLTPKDYDLVSGEIAETTKILSAEEKVTRDIRAEGYPFAKVSKRTVTANHADDLLNVSIVVDRGVKAYFGSVSVEGNEQVKTSLILRVADIPAGGVYSPEVLRDAETRLRALDVFDRARVTISKDVGPNGVVPVLISVSEKKRRFIGANVSVSSIDGLTGSAYWGHRNLFGGAERLRLEVTGAGVGRGTTSDVDYGAKASFIKPAVFDAYTDYTLDIGYQVENPENYSSEAATIRTGFVRRFNKKLTGNIGLEYEHSRVEDDLGTNRYDLFGLPAGLSWDSRDDKLDPSSGFTGNLSVEPIYDFRNSNSFVITTADATAYWALDEKKRFIFAGRVGVGSIPGASLEDIPANRRFLLGGGGSVRGFKYRNIGVDLGNDSIVAGRSMLELSAEARIRITDSIGIVPFIDAGAAYDSPYPDFSEELRVGAGLGLRYYTAIGPIRLDAAVPINPGTNDPQFAIYLGLGQAF